MNKIAPSKLLGKNSFGSNNVLFKPSKPGWGAGIRVAAPLWFCLPMVAAFLSLGMGVVGAATLVPKIPLTGSNLAARAGFAGLSTNAIEDRLTEARAALAAELAIGEAGLTNKFAGVSLQDVVVRRALLQRLVRLLEQQLSNVAELETIRRRREEMARQAQTETGLAGLPPYSVLVTDRLREETQAEQLKIAGDEAALSTIDQLVAENRSSLTRAEEKIRQLNEHLEGKNDATAAVARWSWLRELERLRSQAAAASVGVLDSERRLRQEALAESRLRIGWIRRQLVVAEAEAQFTQADLDQVTARIETNRQQLDHKLTEVEARLNPAAQALAGAREELRLIQARPEAGLGAASRATETVAAREAQLETVQASIRALRLLLECDNFERTMWEIRFASHNTRSASTLSESERRLAIFTRRANLWKDFQQQQLEASPAQIEVQEARARSLAPDSELLPPIREHLAALHERDELWLRLMRRLEQVQRLNQRCAEALRVSEGRLPLLGHVQNLFSDAGSFLGKLWTFELFAAEDTITVEGQQITGKRSVTLGKVITAILILVVGIWVTGLVSRVAEPIIIRRLNIETNQANLIRRWLRALMVVCLVMFSLVSVKIPLTVFAFAGGALAIGLGFGMQNLLKNFVSGLILLFERPFRVGDLLDVGGQRGTITQVGLRASVLQLWDDTETLIPNSSLLENNVTNWTYSNRRVRFTVSVGVDYASDPRRVTQVLNDVAERHGLVEKDPKPQVMFVEFGDSTLMFELRFWVDVGKANAAQVSSDLRQMIVGSFAEHGIIIAFPQRDIRLHPAHPIPVHVVTVASSGETGQKPGRADAGEPATKHEALPENNRDAGTGGHSQ